MFIAQQASKFTHRYGAIFRGLGVVAVYAIWTQIYYLIAITLVTYFVMSSGIIDWEKFAAAAGITLVLLFFLRFLHVFASHRIITFTLAVCFLALVFLVYFVASPGMNLTRVPRFQDIADTYNAYEIILVGIAAILYVVILSGLYPLTSTRLSEIFSLRKLERNFVPGFASGSALAFAVVLAFLISQLYRYQGSPIQLENAPADIAIFLGRVIVLFLFVLAEEYLFRDKVLGFLLRQIPKVYAAALVSVAYCLVKALQFDLGIMQMITFFLISMALSIVAIENRDFVRGAGFWAAVLIIFHPFLGLPIFGNEFNYKAILLVQYQVNTLNGIDPATARFLTGGLGGPLSSFALQLLLILFLVHRVFIRRKFL